MIWMCCMFNIRFHLGYNMFNRLTPYPNILASCYKHPKQWNMWKWGRGRNTKSRCADHSVVRRACPSRTNAWTQQMMPQTNPPIPWNPQLTSQVCDWNTKPSCFQRPPACPGLHCDCSVVSAELLPGHWRGNRAKPRKWPQIISNLAAECLIPHGIGCWNKKDPLATVDPIS